MFSVPSLCDYILSPMFLFKLDPLAVCLNKVLSFTLFALMLLYTVRVKIMLLQLLENDCIEPAKNS